MDGDAVDKALELAREILPQGPVALEMAKKAIDTGISKEVRERKRGTGQRKEKETGAERRTK